MADDASRFDPELSEEDELFLMANLYPRDTGLPMTVWVSPRGGARHDARIKVSATPGDRMELDGAAVVAIRPEPRLIHGELAGPDYALVAAWIIANQTLLIDYWNGDASTGELIRGLRVA